jgi:predicted dehydrogenase
VADQLRVALVGGRRSRAAVAGLRSMPECRITAVCDVDPDALERIGDLTGVAESGRFRQYDDLLERTSPDAVFIATPMHLHVPQSIQALDQGVHVLSEVTAAVTPFDADDPLEQCRQLVRAARRSRAQYMMAENSCFARHNMVVRNMARADLFGRCYFAEGEYVHDVKTLHHQPDGAPAWRAAWQVGKRGATYVTHPLGPALEFFGPEARVVTVNCAGSGVHTDPEHPHDDTCILLCHLNTGGLIRIRLDMMSNRPQNRYMSLQGTAGAYEGPRDARGEHHVWLEPEWTGGQETAPARREWRSLWGYAEPYLPDEWREVSPEALAAGHGGSDYFCVRAFARAVLEGRPVPIDVYRAMDYTVPGLVSEQSILRDGAPLPVPDLREPLPSPAAPA